MPAIDEITHAAKNSRLLKVGMAYTKTVKIAPQKGLSRTSLEAQMYKQKHAIVNHSIAKDVANVRRTEKRMRVR
jgi:hypothetical protein